MPKFETNVQFENWLASVGMFHMELGLGRMRKALELLDLQKPPFKVIQILGTNGKGSTCAFLAQLALDGGIRAGLYTSPHFLSPRERIKVDNCEIEEEVWLKAANQIAALYNENLSLTYFEILTLMALLIFREKKVKIAILEAGLGGANDATSAVAADIHCFTPIAMDHAAIIGPALSDIARDKSQAIKTGSVVFSSPQFPAVEEIIKSEAARKSVPVNYAAPLQSGYKLSLSGEFQLSNAALALNVWRRVCSLLNIASSENREKKALRHTFIAGRMQYEPAAKNRPAVILDGGHNPHALLSLCASLLKTATPGAVLYSAFKDKDWRSALGILSRSTGDAIFLIPQMDSERAENAEAIAAYCQSVLHKQAKSFKGDNALWAALDFCQTNSICHDKFCLITGSFYLLGAFFNLYPELIKTPGMRKS